MSRSALTAIVAGVLVVGNLSFARSADEPISFESLLKEMVDRDRLARVPDPFYLCRQASSYDRDSVAPDKPGWFANWDRSQFVRIEQRDGQKEYVLMDANGPGVIVRFWATWHGPRGGPFSNGTLRVYLDHERKPVIEGPIADVIDRGALTGPPLSEGVSPLTPYKRRGHNLYLPIPYAKHCKITYQTDVPIDRGAKKGEALYYQINYRTYEPGTKVESFCMDQLKRARSLLERTQKRLLESGWTETAGFQCADLSGPVAPGKSRSVELEGPRAIRQLTIQLKAADLAQALRSTVLEIHFDGERTVWCPVGAFFGIDYEVHPVRTWYTEVTDDGTMNCFWVMPFERSCRLVVHNLGQQPIEITKGKICHTSWAWDDRSMHFHATWRQLTKVSTRGRKQMTGAGAFDVNYVEVQGAGVYAGDTLSVFNGTNAWWGEGDEKIYVDGESFPSHFGTGTEDYYGYAWCRPEYFTSPFHAQPTGGGNLTVGLSVNSRFRSLDAIPFRRSLKVDMELWHWRDTKVNYAPTTYWYARPGATCNVEPDPKTATLPVARERTDVVEVLQVPGAIEGETLKVAEKTGGVVEVQDVPDFRWSNDQQLWWRQAKPGDRLVLLFPAEKAGRYRVWANLTKARDYGIVELSINGQPTGPFDRYHPQVAHDRLDLGTFTLKEGPNRLAVKITGTNKKAIPRCMFGLDYLLLAPVP